MIHTHFLPGVGLFGSVTPRVLISICFYCRMAYGWSCPGHSLLPNWDSAYNPWWWDRLPLENRWWSSSHTWRSRWFWTWRPDGRRFCLRHFWWLLLWSFHSPRLFLVCMCEASQLSIAGRGVLGSILEATRKPHALHADVMAFAVKKEAPSQKSVSAPDLAWC